MTGWIETYTGKKFYPLDPRPEDVCIEDIAHSLSMQCRFNGHTRVFYSVAEHSLIISDEITSMGYGALSALYGLLHDAAETYLCDLPRPIKEGWGWYKGAEKLALTDILKAFGLPFPGKPVWKMVKLYDNLLLGHEGRTLMPNNLGWAGNITPFQPSTPVIGMPPENAEQQFLVRFYKLMGELTEGW